MDQLIIRIWRFFQVLVQGLDQFLLVTLQSSYFQELVFVLNTFSNCLWNLNLFKLDVFFKEAFLSLRQE